MIESDLLDVYTKVLSPWNLIYKRFLKSDSIHSLYISYVFLFNNCRSN